MSTGSPCTPGMTPVQSPNRYEGGRDLVNPMCIELMNNNSESPVNDFETSKEFPLSSPALGSTTPTLSNVGMVPISIQGRNPRQESMGNIFGGSLIEGPILPLESPNNSSVKITGSPSPQFGIVGQSQGSPPPE